MKRCVTENSDFLSNMRYLNSECRIFMADIDILTRTFHTLINRGPTKSPVRQLAETALL